ncbi:MAG TPA: hypothetical protein IAA98_02035 [Candidatus Avipropionibacterium avicola]|uniref:Zinc ribbon domain-containing protein n=1 Tax=Candidatus Avipropionibacterium avicola TaxID=2840701 RepID=A0A9D1GVK5_9ACTN|nr:hypothetical protein [Candidatus Avipropionibacterium avicola]
MSRCPSCAVEVEGHWTGCPLCGQPTVDEPTPGPLPTVPLRFSRRRVFRVLFLASIAVIVVSFAAQLLFARDHDGIGAARSVWLGVCAMWLVVAMAIRKRRNVAKGTLWLVVITGLVCVYWDYLTAWHRWSLTYAIPIVCACSIVALLILVRVMRLEVGDHILYSGLTVVLGLAPIAFLAFGWVTNPLPSGICGIVSVLALALLQIARGRPVRQEFAKRFHL